MVGNRINFGLLRERIHDYEDVFVVSGVIGRGPKMPGATRLNVAFT